MSIKAGEDIIASDFAFLLGVVLPYAGASAPSGWQLCDGSALTLNAADALYDIINNVFGDGSGTTFTADAGTDFITAVAHGLSNNDIIYLTNSGGALPAGLAVDTKYYVINKTDDTFQVSLTSGGGAVDITGTGTGTHSFHTQFLVPDMRGNLPLGKDNMGGVSRDRVTHTNADTIGGEEGSEDHVITEAEMPTHFHTVTKGSGGGSGPLQNSDGGTGSTQNTDSKGSDNAHENMSPYMTLNYIIRTAV